MPAVRTLADGSAVELNAAAVIREAFSENVRRVFLESGEAHFQVAKNVHRPFVVVANGVEIKAVGTAFSVQLGTDKVDVVVTEGRVAVSERPEAPSPVHVDAGQAVVVRPVAEREEVGPVTAIGPDELAQRLAWRIPMLELNLTPLGEVIPVIAQHTGTKISLGDSSLAKLRLTGRLRANNLSVLLQILETSYGLSSVANESHEVVIQRSH